MLKAHSVWMFATPACPGSRMGPVTADRLRDHLGDFKAIREVARCAARISQCFSSTTATSRAGLSLSEIVDVERNGFCFSDGVGTISLAMAQKVCAGYRASSNRRRLIASRHRGSAASQTTGTTFLLPPNLPSAFQILLGGCKGMLSLDTRLAGEKVCVRPSMKKFECSNDTVEICSTARPTPAFLNRQIITLLSCLGVPDPVFLALQYDMMEKLRKGVDTNDAARALLLSGCSELHGAFDVGDIDDCLCAGFDVSRELFIASMLSAVRTSQLREVKDRARVHVPASANLTGVMDELGLLQYGECYFVCDGAPFDTSSAAAAAAAAVTGTDARSLMLQPPWLSHVAVPVVVTKCPCLHPGDIRVLKSVPLQVLAGRHPSAREHYAALRGVLVFPQHGHRPHPNEASGSDLDGDVYFVAWDQRLLPPPSAWHEPPADYTPPSKLTVEVVTTADITKFFVDFVTNDNLGIIASAHLALADEFGARDARCITLASLHATAVDFAKTGVAANFNADRRLRPTKYRDFMEKRDKDSYESQRVLGKMYRAACDAVKASAPASIATATSTADTIIADPDLLLPGRGQYYDLALRTYREYRGSILSLMQKFGISSEAELMTGHVARFHSQAFRKRRFAEARDMLDREVRDLNRTYRQIFVDIVRAEAEKSAHDGAHADETGISRAGESASDSVVDPNMPLLPIPGLPESLGIGKLLASAWYAVTYDFDSVLAAVRNERSSRSTWAVPASLAIASAATLTIQGLHVASGRVDDDDGAGNDDDDAVEDGGDGDGTGPGRARNLRRSHFAAFPPGMSLMMYDIRVRTVFSSYFITTKQMSKEFTLADVPADGISALAWLSPTTLAAAFWDTSVRLYDTNQNDGAKGVYRHKAPVLDVCAGPGGNSVVSGGVDMDVRL